MSIAQQIIVAQEELRLLRLMREIISADMRSRNRGSFQLTSPSEKGTRYRNRGSFHLTSPSSMECWVKNVRLTVSIDIMTGELVAGYKSGCDGWSGWIGSWCLQKTGDRAPIRTQGMVVIAVFEHANECFLSYRVPLSLFRYRTTTIARRQIWDEPYQRPAQSGFAYSTHKWTIVPMTMLSGIERAFVDAGEYTIL
jgi:hypothetical protein